MTYAQQMPGLLQKGKADTQDCKAWVDEQLSEMSLKEKIGWRTRVIFPGLPITWINPLRAAMPAANRP